MRLRRLLWLGIGLILLLGIALRVTPGRSLDTPGVHIPSVLKGYLPFPLTLSSAWTENATATPANEFAAGDEIQYYGSGSNSEHQPIDVELSWTLDNFCGQTLIHTEIASLTGGDWTAMFSQTAPACSGVTDYTFQARFNQHLLEAVTQFTVVNPVGPEVWARAAFDKCDNPSISEMQTWWTYSPYWAVNIYIGGIHRACANADLTPEWVRAVLDQGWALIPTWVGPQAPCTDFKYRFSDDLTEAYQQGRAEADAATLTAASLGLTSYGASNTIIYYDLEGYAEEVTPECRAATKSFVNGWVERMHELGNPAGMYGSPCSSYASDWATIPNVPDDVWLAAWYYPFYYDPDATVYGVSCVSDNLWYENQRLRQYSGGHRETWGDLEMIIDSDVTEGAVLALNTVPETVDPSRLGRTLSVAGPVMTGVGALSADQAWALLDGGLFWTADTGEHWAAIGPEEAQIQAATFLDEQHGWLVGALSNVMPAFTVWRTTDGGQIWQEMPFAADGEIPLDARAVALDFTSPQDGWLVLQLISSANFNRGRLFHTRDGGITWEERSLPGGGMIDFVDAHTGWTMAGPQADMLYQTLDGGWSWQPVGSVVNAPLRLRDPLQGSLPEAAEISYVNAEVAWAISRAGECSLLDCTISSAIWRTLDGGRTWAQVSLPGETQPYSFFP